MNYLLFDSLTEELPLAISDDAPSGFRFFTDYAFDPETGTQSGNPVTNYWVSFLCPSTAIFSQVKQRLLTQRDTYFNSEQLDYITCVINSDYGTGLYNGSYDIWFVLEGEWFTRIGDTWEVRLQGYGSPPIASRIVPGQIFSVSESATLGTIVGTVSGFEQTLEYRGRPDIPLAYDPATGVISVSGPLDFEGTDSYDLDIGGETVTVYVIDVAEAPRPERTSYTFYLDAGSKTGSQVGSVLAETQGNSGVPPTYSIVSGNNNSFAIDSITGDIVVTNISSVTDGQVLGISYASGQPLITCTIKLVAPDSGPVFEPYRFSLNANPVLNQVVGAISEPGVTLSLIDSTYGINGTNLVVLAPELVETGLTELSIKATTTGFQEGSITVYITVPEDTANNFGDQEFWIAEDSGNGTVIGSVDFDDNSPNLTYTLDPVGIFDINSKTGDIILVNSSLLAVGTYNLTSSAGVGYSKAIVVKVYAVQAESDASFSISSSATVGQLVGTIPGVYPLVLASGSLGVFSLDLATGVITVASLPLSGASFTVEDANTDSISVQIEVSNDSSSSDSAVIGAVYPGQTGQTLLSIQGIKFSIHEVALGDGSVNITPDNLGSISRNIGGSVVFDKPSVVKHELSFSATVNTAIMAALTGYFTNSTEITCSVPGYDFIGVMVGLRRSYGGDNPSAQVTVKEL